MKWLERVANLPKTSEDSWKLEMARHGLKLLEIAVHGLKGFNFT